MAGSGDAEMSELAADEVRELEARIEAEGFELTQLLVPKDPRDDANIFLEIRAGTGGDEAAIFAGDLFRMYARYAERQGWKVEVLSESQGEHGGYKEIISRVVGRGAYSQLKFESGAHRVQRVPATESQGRIHTSACTVAILPELDEIDDVVINPADLRVDTYRASGAGGQHVNKTDSAIRITHVPTGIVVECQDERSQHKNRSRAMSLLRARLLEAQQQKQSAQQAQERKLQVGHRRPLRAHPHVQLPAGPRDGSPHQPDALPAARDHGRRARRRDRAAAERVAGGATREPGIIVRLRRKELVATEISQLIGEGVARLGRVTDQPRHEAEILLAAALVEVARLPDARIRRSASSTAKPPIATSRTSRAARTANRSPTSCARRNSGRCRSR